MSVLSEIKKIRRLMREATGLETPRRRRKKKSTEKRKKKRKEKLPRVIKAVDFQRGRSKTSIDKKRKAMKPGKRKSKNRKIYYEYRKNRSDLREKV